MLHTNIIYLYTQLNTFNNIENFKQSVFKKYLNDYYTKGKKLKRNHIGKRTINIMYIIILFITILTIIIVIHIYISIYFFKNIKSLTSFQKITHIFGLVISNPIIFTLLILLTPLVIFLTDTLLYLIILIILLEGFIYLMSKK